MSLISGSAALAELRAELSAVLVTNIFSAVLSHNSVKKVYSPTQNTVFDSSKRDAILDYEGYK